MRQHITGSIHLPLRTHCSACLTETESIESERAEGETKVCTFVVSALSLKTIILPKAGNSQIASFPIRTTSQLPIAQRGRALYPAASTNSRTQFGTLRCFLRRSASRPSRACRFSAHIDRKFVCVVSRSLCAPASISTWGLFEHVQARFC